jgi:hypothetical protein
LTHSQDNSVVVTCLPSHASITTQPNDNGINKKFHDHYGDCAQEWRVEDAGLRIQKGDANAITSKGWDRTVLEVELMKRGFNSTTTGIFLLDPNAQNYRDLSISEAATPHDETSTPKAAQTARAHDHQVRARAHKECVCFKRHQGPYVALLRAAILEQSQRLWLKSAKETAETRSKRAMTRFPPREHQTPKSVHVVLSRNSGPHLRNIKEHQDSKAQLLQEKEGRKKRCCQTSK